MSKEKVALVGSGNWGSAIATKIGINVLANDLFDNEVQMWVFEEYVKLEDGKWIRPARGAQPPEGKTWVDEGYEPLTEVINRLNENVIYLPGIKLPKSIVAQPDIKKCVTGATMLVFVIPHNFLAPIVPKMEGAFAPGAVGISLIKGIEFKDSKPILISDLLAAEMKKGPNAPDVDMSVLMGANVANEVAKGDFAEATVGCTDLAIGAKWVQVFNTPDFKVDPVMDVAGAELCGALKNVVALGAGFCDGLGFGGNTKAAIIRVGLKEMQKFCEVFYGDRKIKQDTFLESCGLADLVTTCFGGRNRKCADIFAKCQKEGTPKAWDVIETEELNGQKLQGTGTAKDVMTCIKAAGKEADFPLMCQIYRIAFEDAKCETIIQINNSSAAAPAAAAPAAAPAAKGAPPAAPAAPAGPLPDGVTAMNGMQKAVVKNMNWANSVPTYQVSRAIGTGELDALYAKLKPKGVTVSALLAKAVGVTLAKHPIMNAAYAEDAIKYNANIDVAMAVALPDGGLVTPTMRAADTNDLYSLSREWKDMVGRTMEGKLKPSEMGGTFTISNLGMFGVSNFVSILPPGTGAILAVAASTPTFVQQKNGMIGMVKQMTVTLTCDHRHIYGADAAKFLKDLADLIENDMDSLLY